MPDRETDRTDLRSSPDKRLISHQTEIPQYCAGSADIDIGGEPKRISALRSFNILDTRPETAFDRITHLVSRCFRVPIALISLVDSDRQWFKSHCGIDADQTPRSIALCDHAIRSPDVMIVPDARLDQRFADNPLVTGDMGLRFYAGAPLIDADGMALGTLCIIDRVPRTIDADEIAILRDFAAQVVHELVVRSTLGELYTKVDQTRQADRRLAEVRLQYDSLLNATGSGTVTFDSDGRIMSWNIAAERIFGYSAAEAIGLPIGTILPDFSTETLTALAQYETISTQYAIGWHKDGHGVPIEQAAALWRNHEGIVSGGAVLHDASDRRRIKEDFQRNQTHLSEAQRIGGLGSWDWHLATHEIKISDEMAHLLGVPAGQPRKLEDALRSIHVDDQALWQKTMDAIITGHQAAAVTYRMNHPDGTIHFFQSQGQLVEMSDGPHLIGVVKDITEQRQRDAELRESERLAALGQLAGGVAHEINNLLQPIISLTEIVQDDLAARATQEVDAELLEHLAVVMTCGRQARDIVRKILRYARQETPTLKPTKLSEILDRAIALVRDLLPPGVKLSVHDAIDTDGEALVDAGELTQVIANLAVNADHAMKSQGALDISLERTQLTADTATALGMPIGSYFLVKVADTGCGMDAATQARIFDPFFTTKPVGQGTGLGLSMVHGIIKSWGGAISVASTVGKGTEFRLYVPIVTS
jgi:PAS domain S-box-containing protein